MSFLQFLFRLFIKITGAIPFPLYFKPKIYHEDKRDKDGLGFSKCILLMNHNFIRDAFLMILLFPFRAIHLVVGEFAHRDRGKFVGGISSLYGNIHVDRSNIDMNYMNKCAKILKKGGIVGIFPEGHFGKRDGSVQEFKLSAIYLALQTNTPIKLIYSDFRYGLFKRASVNISKKIYLSDYTNKKNITIDEAKALAEILRKKMLELKKQMEEYKKLKTYHTLNFRWFILDFVRITSFLVAPIIYPRKRHYLTKDNKKIKIPKRAIIISNHPSFQDPFLMHLYFLGRRVHVITAEELYRDLGKFFRWWFYQSGCIKYRRLSESKVDLLCFREACSYLNTNCTVGIFPEGHVHLDGKMREFNGGAALLAMMSKTTIYPYYSCGKPEPFKMHHLIYGDPINIKDYFGEKIIMNNDTIVQFNSILTDKMHKLEEEGLKYIKEK